jgi:2-(1,2-epoxy-1,2-dihydrophenyl)acetyl-CoA isomerase
MTQEGCAMAEQSQLVIERRDGVGWITFNRPDELNVLTSALLEELLTELELLGNDDSIRSVVIAGSGKAFSAGGNLSAGLNEITGTGSSQEQTERLRRFMKVAELLVQMPKPTICAINGACAGGSLGIACAADIRIASEKAIFATAFLTVGISGDFAGSWGLSRAVGPGLARELYLTGRRVNATTALQIGLVSEVVAPDELMDRVHVVASELAARSPLAVRVIKEIFNALDNGSLMKNLDTEAAHQVELINTRDANEARMAFLEKRQPTFIGE